MNGRAVTLGQLLAMGLLREHEVLGGAGGLDRPVRMVVPGTTVHGIGDLAPNSVVVFGPDQLALDELGTDLALRLARSAGLSGIIAHRPSGKVPLVTRRLADKLNLPLVGVDEVAPAAVAATFDPYVRAPEIAGLRILGTTAQRFQTPPTSANELTRTLSQTLGGPVTLVDGRAGFVAGDSELHRLLAEPEIRARLGGSQAGASTVSLGEADALLLHPVRLERAGQANFWLVARLHTATGALLEPLRQSLAIAALSFAVYVAGNTAALERESRARSLLLGEVLDQTEAPSPRAVERAAALGWRLAGWHTAVQIAVKESGGTARPGELMAELEEELTRGGLTAALVERPDGWAFWTTAQSEPDSVDPRPLLESVRSALLAVVREHAGLSLCAGIGGAWAGTSGIQRSLDEARRACLLAMTEHGVAPVEHVDAVSMKRLLVGWYASGSLRSVAAEIVTPLLEADPSGELVRTLRRYLDQESSVTETAALLGIHRNTVMQRMERIRTLLPVSLDDPDDRIVVHLATRAVGIDWDEHS
ncbi:helix-turn-helix domain-containing protein [Pseudonocardia spinosispora]|uniref:helix-turn-helix domain-containing protein n=1 Tax=Pseudonocardia spinosispora TaxID=103441 RepID=UPI00040DB238|nr:helix-turn-helix domain-containing protein [Pseudonocardia spinosispora]